MINQSLAFRGIFEFEDPSGLMLAVRQPVTGPVDLFSGTKLIVRPNQVAILVHEGKLADLYPSGSHTLDGNNTPFLTRLMNWKFGFESPVKSEIWFFATQVFTSRKWGSSGPVLAQVGNQTLPLRSFGVYNIRVKNPRSLFLNLIGSQSLFSVAQLDEFVIAQILEVLPQCLSRFESLADLSSCQESVSQKLTKELNQRLDPFGLAVPSLQVMSVLPPPEVLKAMDAKLSMDIIGNKQDYLAYKAAQGFDSIGGQTDPLQLMMSLMMSKNFGTAQNAPVPAQIPTTSSQSTNGFCGQCGDKVTEGEKFCTNCGNKVGA